MFGHDATAELWSDSRVKCVLVPHGHQVEVELRNADGSAFLRKTAATRQAALNEAEYLRLLLLSAGRPSVNRGLKPFALVVENDPDHHDALAGGLRLSGMRALTCRSGVEALSLAHDLTPDVIVLDYSVTDMSSTRVIAHLRESSDTAGIPVIAVTGDEDVTREACGADAVLTAPCHVETLLVAARLFVPHLQLVSDSHS
jgi:CheY-like chemotaxis protein